MITALIVIASVIGYTSMAAYVFQKTYVMAYEQRVERGRTYYELSAAQMGWWTLPIALIWPVSLPFVVMWPTPPTIAQARLDKKRDREEKELRALERAAGIRQ